MTMSQPASTRVAFVHTGAVVIEPVARLRAEHLPDVVAVNYLDDRIVADLGADESRESVGARLENLVSAAKSSGAEAVMLTCSSISGYAASLESAVGIPVLRIDEAMADTAVSEGGRITVIATLATTSAPTTALLHERAALLGTSPTITGVVVDGAFEAIVSGDRATHDRLVGDAIVAASADSDVIVLAQASMAGAADTVSVEVPVLTSLELGIRRLGDFLAR
ncbi:MAG: aspartate/glutamate racemase family protein [Microcella sp.]|uniref:aspartate/glutamate racemase family protein n=1 Tax=Microcella sp. TaxID=1913979 RepID=UPI0024C900BD|nr:aspartate/glutamate racemase family protein [Microcella sp.]UYN83159.1 MAG: aspartate/glutamate racemase family protein [Microcella sp.]